MSELPRTVLKPRPGPRATEGAPVRRSASVPALAAALPAALLLVAAPPAGAQLQPSPALQDAYFAWDAGRYEEAMEGYLRVLEGPGGDGYVEEIAVLTGELHPVRAVDEDGSRLAVSPDGSRLLWHRELEEGWVIRIEPVEGGEGRLELPGVLGAFSPDGGVAYVDREGGLHVRDLTTGVERTAVTEGILPLDLVFAPDRGDVFVTAGMAGAGDRLHILHLPEGAEEPRVLELGPGHAAEAFPAAGGRFLVFTRPGSSPLGVPQGEEPTETPEPGIGILDLETGRVARLDGDSPSLAPDGSLVAFRRTGEDGTNRILALDLDDGAIPATGEPDLRLLLETERPLADPAVAPGGERVAFQMQPHWTWEIFVVRTDGSGEAERITREAQHDRFARWISDRLLLAMKGEFRHRRSYVYDLATGERYRLHHNNTLRTIAPEYDWAPHPDGAGVFVSAERDGDTISPERAVWWVDLTRTVTRDDLVARLRDSLEAERDLLERGRRAFEPIADEVRAVTGEVSFARIFHYADALYSVGTKYFTEPGNQEAIRYLTETLESWGYEVELQWWEPRGVRTANVVATLPGTRDPELVYVISSHFDSVLRAPGADDNSSGTTALLEAARVLRDHPRQATIQFAFLSAEEAGLLGAREFVRLAVEEDKRVAGVLNNDMIGWTRSHRLDNTIRYSNPGIKDIQHAASHHFSDLITYDALYYRGTDAAVFFDAYGDVVGGIGSYPVLGNPHYHQATDKLETIDQRLVAEVSRTTVASIMLLADSPARLADLRVEEEEGGSGTVVAWTPAPESGVTGYRVRGRNGGDGSWRELEVVPEARFRVPTDEGVSEVKVRAVRDDGTEGWDWAYLVLP